MNQIQLQYKRETGNSAIACGIEAEFMTDPLDSVFMMEFSAKEIIDLIAHDKHYKSVKLKDVPEEFKDVENLCLPDSGYIKWLEEKVMELQKLTE